MSMNFSEFKKLIGADPLNREPETLKARQSAPEFELAAAEAEAFEAKLQAALRVSAPIGLLNDIKQISQQADKKRNWIPLALAASLLITLGTVGLVWKQSHQWDSVEDYLADHYSHDGSALVKRATDVVDEEEVAKIMALLGASIDQPMTGDIRFIKLCPTPDGRGAHMVVSTEQGPMTIIYMPKTRVIDGEMIDFDQQHALLVNLEHGSAAIIGTQSQAVENLQYMLKTSIRTGLLGA